MKKIKYIIGRGAFMLLTIFATVSCTDGNDWDVDNSYERLFSVTSSSLSISPEATTAEFKWTKTPGTQYYIIEVSKDTLYNEVPMNNANSIVFGEDKTITQSPYVLADLDSDSKYFIRIKAMSSVKTESKWTYPEKSSFKTKSEQIISKYIYGESSAKLEWEAGLAVTHLMIVKDNVGKRQDLSSDNIAQGTIEITGLETNTEYTIYILNNEITRGKVTFKTLEAVSGPGVRFELNGTEDLQAYIDALTSNEVILVLPSSSKYNVDEALNIPDHITALTLWGSAGEEKSYLRIKEVKLNTQETFYLRIHNMEVEGVSAADHYILNDNPSGTRTITNLTIDNCYAHAFRGISRFRGSLTISDISIDNCIIDNIGSYGVLNTDAATVTIGSIAIQNSTISNISGGDAFKFKGKVTTSLILNQCTFYNLQNAASRYFVNFDGKTANIPSTFNIRNSILASNTGSELLLRATNPAITTNFVDNLYYTKDYSIDSKYPYTGISSYNGTSSQLFNDPANKDFSIKDGSFNNNIGDPRWR